MATRIVVMGAKPGRIRRIIENKLPYPRDYRNREFQRLVDEIHAVITETELPDVHVEAASAACPPKAAPWEPLPEAGASQVIGLLEVLDDHGGSADVFHVADHIGQEFGRVLAVTKAAELLDLVDTPKQNVVITAEGKQFLAASPHDRKVMFRERVKALHIFIDVLGMIGRAGRHRVDADAVLEMLALKLPYEDPERMMHTLVSWGRYADLFDYDQARKELFIESRADVAAD
jgi:NitT/TauT family transport system ATP-binding protein